MTFKDLDTSTALCWFALAISCASAALASTQGVQTGTIRGKVHDDQELVVPGVAVTVTSPALQGPRTGITGTDGGYTFATLPPGEPFEPHRIRNFLDLICSTRCAWLHNVRVILRLPSYEHRT